MVRKLLVLLSVATMLAAASPALAVGCKGCVKVAKEGHGFCCENLVHDNTPDDTTRRQAEYLAATLGIEWLCDEPMRTGTIKLIDLEKQTVLASVTSPNQLPVMESALDKVLP